MSAAPTISETGTGVFSRTRARIGERTLRTDRWWVPPLATVVGLAAFIIYATVRAYVRADYWDERYHYLTPFYSPCVSTDCATGSTHFGAWFGHIPAILPLGFMVLPFLLGFRLTCYYYRKAYYRSVWFSPPACAVAEPHAKYTGETRLPLIIQNVHRYFFYVAVIVSLVNTWDAIYAFHGPKGGFGFGLGNIIILINVILLWAYTLSCHSCRHIAGGRLKHFSAHPVRYWFWTQVSKLNTRHMQLAWTTLGTLVLTDFYVMLVAGKHISDLRFIN
ncbi:hypothetical protein F5544_44970 [Nocardia arthritidis]|uniref:Succinate dehydrogenase n=1 Tax=Nocardia arthritidis TaxID=228602 RepID=A0A6G9YUJ3_9NOCA|nr:hypothetical protein [Nocardia arthritidis]QIS16797.1 hypothetical protein F5544_44970 [Nocardia arthritidis]